MMKRWIWTALGVIALAVALAFLLWQGSARNQPAQPAGEPSWVAGPAPTAGAAGAGAGEASAPASLPEAGEAVEEEPSPVFAEGRHNEVDPEFEAVEVDGEVTSYIHAVGGFRVELPSRFHTSVPQLGGPILGRFFLAPGDEALFGIMLYAAALEYIPPGGDEFLAEFEQLTDEDLYAMSGEFLGEGQVAQAARKLFHHGVPGIELVARDLQNGLMQVTRIFFRENQMVMVSGLVPLISFIDQEAFVRSYLDSLRWL